MHEAQREERALLINTLHLRGMSACTVQTVPGLPRVLGLAAGSAEWRVGPVSGKHTVWLCQMRNKNNRDTSGYSEIPDPQPSEPSTVDK